MNDVLRVNPVRRFEAAKESYLDLVRVPELRGKVPGLEGTTAGNLNGTSYRLYNWKPQPEPGERQVEFSTYKAQPWSLWVRFWRPDGNGGWKAVPAPSSFDDDFYLEDEENTEIWVTATNITEGNLSRWLLLDPEALDKNARMLPGWGSPRHFKSLAEMEEALFALMDSLLEPSTEEGPRAYLEAQIAEADDVSSLKSRVLSYFQKKLTRAQAATNTVVAMLLNNAKLAFDEAFPEEGEGVDAFSIIFPDEEEFVKAFAEGADGYQSAMFGEGFFFSHDKKTNKKFVISKKKKRTSASGHRMTKKEKEEKAQRIAETLIPLFDPPSPTTAA